ncbi:hypothetical protein, partial [uncultured Lactococcus sp.]|uniref:hypothetical protein n=1 Tax=uncultured Lactococcus sp. TaxID=167973 RepID=UPI0027DBCD61
FLFLLTACGNHHINEPQKLETSVSKEEKSVPKQKKKQESSSSSTTEEKATPFDPEKAEQAAEDFVYSYYDYNSENERNKNAKTYCTEALQKKLNLVQSEQSIAMKSSITSFHLYEEIKGSEENQDEEVQNKAYLVLVTYDLNGNSVTPQVLKLSVQQVEGKYLVNQMELPLMN